MLNTKIILGSVFFMLALLLTACGGGGSGGSGTPAAAACTAPVTGVKFCSGQAASVVIGQANFTSGLTNQGGAVAANTLGNSDGAPFVNGGVLYLPDGSNRRTLVYNSIPAINNASANFAIGQPNLTSNTQGTTATSVQNPGSAVIAGTKLIQADAANDRVTIYNTVPTSGPATIDVVVGQTNMTNSTPGCTASTLRMPGSVATAGSKLIVADTNNHRVLIWNTIPTADGTAADVVLGQTDFTHCTANGGGGAAAANTMNYPVGTWSDGTRLAVVDELNNRVLIWNSIPTGNNQAADLVLGQPNFTSTAPGTTATTMRSPYTGVFFNSAQFFVGDRDNSRVLVWNSFPTTNGQAADVVLGEPNLMTNAGGTSAALMVSPEGMFLYGKQLIVNDTANARALIFNGQ